MTTATLSSISERSQPTLGELVKQYVAVGISKERAIHYIVHDSRLRSQLARGKGNRAAKREAQLAATRADRMADEFHGYAAKCEGAARKVFGVLHVTNSDIASRANVESPQF